MLGKIPGFKRRKELQAGCYEEPDRVSLAFIQFVLLHVKSWRNKGELSHGPEAFL